MAALGDLAQHGDRLEDLEEQQANRTVQEPMLAALGLLTDRLDNLEEQHASRQVQELRMAGLSRTTSQTLTGTLPS